MIETPSLFNSSVQLRDAADALTVTLVALQEVTPVLVSCPATSGPAPDDARFVIPAGAVSTLEAVR